MELSKNNILALKNKLKDQETENITILLIDNSAAEAYLIIIGDNYFGSLFERSELYYFFENQTQYYIAILTSKKSINITFHHWLKPVWWRSKHQKSFRISDFNPREVFNYFLNKGLEKQTNI